MHYREGINSRSQIVDHNPGAFGQALQSADGKRLPNIEQSEEDKAHEKSFPKKWDGDKGDQLACDFVDDYELRIFGAVGTGYACGRGNAN